MAITSLDDYIAAQKQLIRNFRIGNRTTAANTWFSMAGMTGFPGGSVLAGADTTSGVVETDETEGHPRIRPFPTGGKGYITRAAITNNYASRIRIFDLLWKGGAYAYNANVTLSGQPSFASRLPLDGNGDPIYEGLEIWHECVTNFSGSIVLTVTYTDQDGNTGATSGAYAFGTSPIAGRLTNVPFATGDNGVRKIESVTSTGLTAGTYNILIIRPLIEVRINNTNQGFFGGLDAMGFTEIFADSAIDFAVAPDSTGSGTIDMYLEIASK